MGLSKVDFSDGWTIIRGGTFLSNFLAPVTKFMYPSLETEQTITTALKPDYLASVLDPADIGVVATEMLTCDTAEWNEKWNGRCIPMAKENLTMADIVGLMNAALEHASGKKHIQLIQVTEEEAKQRAAQGDMVVASQIFQNQYMSAYSLEEVQSSGVDVRKMVSSGTFFDRAAARLLETVGEHKA